MFSLALIRMGYIVAALEASAFYITKTFSMFSRALIMSSRWSRYILVALKASAF